MSVINRFEVANYLNLDQTADWRPDYRHVVFNLRGQSTAINLGNGGGKSTLTRGILVLLGRDREFQSMTRDKMAPENTGVYSHLRIELLFRDEPREADLFARAGQDLPGEPWVFGVYGYSGKGQQLHFYRYQGRLEDCPVAETSGRKVVLIGNEAFRHTLRQVRGVLVNPDSPEWLREVGRHFDPGSVRQMIEYQKRGAGDGTASFFKVTRLPGERYDEAFFYNVLAPEVLVGVMGAEAERDEHRFEDTVLISARTISDAMYAADRKRREVETLERACQEVEKVKGRVEDFAAARRRHEAECSGLAAEAAFLEHIVLIQPLPGIPAAPLPEAPQTAWTAARLVLADGQWLLPDWVIGDITGEEPSRLNERARRKQMGSVAIRPGHVIEVPQAGDTAPERRHSGAPANAGYGREAATRLIAEASHIAEGWERDAAQRAVNGAFTWIDKAETNTRRKKVHALSAEIAELKTRIQDLARAEHEAEQIQRALALRRQSVHAARHAQERMSASGLFSAEELTAPAATGAKVKHERQAAAAARAAHEREAARLARPFAAWQDFTAEHGSGADPSALAARLEAARTEAEARADQAREHREELLEQLAAAEREASEIERRLTAATAAAEELEALLPGVQAFAARFPDHVPAGLEEAGDRALKEARQRRHDLDRRLHGLKSGIARLEALQPGFEAFRALFGAESPRGLESACLAARDEARQRLTRLDTEQVGLSRHIQALTAFRAAHGETADAPAIAAARRQRWEDLADERRRLEERRGDLRRRRQGLDAARVAAGRLADQALKLAGTEVRPLHEVVDSLGLDAARCEVVLTHFSALLFAPVAADADAAHAAAARLEAAGLEVPVLVTPDLAEFCRFGRIIARPDSGDAHGWMLGLRSPAVRCLLDAAQTEAEKARLEAELAELATRLDMLAKALADLTPDSPAGRLIAAALAAGEAKAEARLAQTEVERAIIEAALPDLERRAAEPAREAIRAMRDFETLGGMEALVQSRAAAREAEAQLEELDERLPELEERVSPEARAAIRAALDFARRGGGERLERLAGERAGLSTRKSAFAEEARRRRFAGDAARLAVEAAEAELRRAAQALLVIPGLKDLAAFLAEDGPMVMAAAEERRERLDAALERAEARLLRFDFDLAQAYVDALAHGQEAEIENAAREAEATLETMRRQAAQARTRLDEARAEREHARDLARRLDEAALAALRQYRAARKAVEDLDPAALTEGGVTPALERARRVLAALADPEESDEDKVGRIEDLRADIAEFAIAERSKEIGALREAKDSAARQLTGEISRVLKLPELGLSDNEKHLLEEARDNPPRAQELHAHLERQYTENRSLHEKAVEALNERRLNLADNLKHMAARLALNYQLMRKALAWKVGTDGTLTEAGFELSANVTGEQQVGELIQEIIDAIELAEKRRREDEERGQAKLSRDQHAEHLKAQIRKAFYRRMFAEPSIRLRHPELKGGRGHVFDDRISTGQQNAVTLMLMLKLADYAIERDIRQHADSAQHRRRLRALAQKVVIIDGLFSNLTDRALIRQSMAAMAKVRGDFQLIGWIHNPLYQNNSEIFPTYVVARRMRRGEGGNYVYVEDGRIIEAETLGRREGEVDTMTFHVDQVPMPAAE